MKRRISAFLMSVLLCLALVGNAFATNETAVISAKEGSNEVVLRLSGLVSGAKYSNCVLMVKRYEKSKYTLLKPINLQTTADGTFKKTFTDDPAIPTLHAGDTLRFTVPSVNFASGANEFTVPVATPVFDQSDNTVTISCDTDDHKIYYTTDGTEPSASKTLYTTGIVLGTGTTTTIKAIAIKDDCPDSEVASKDFTYTPPGQVATPVISRNGTRVTISCATAGATIYYTIDGNTPSASSLPYPNGGFDITESCTVKAIAIKDGISSAVASQYFDISDPTPPERVATPVFSRNGTRVTITCATVGAKIYYTIGGSTPTTSSTPYTTDYISIGTGTTIIKAIAAKEGMTNSRVATATYTISSGGDDDNGGGGGGGDVVPTPAMKFTDVPTSSVYYDAIVWAVEKGITKGLTETTFGPKTACTRGQGVTFLWRAAGCPEPTITKNPFKDVSESSPFYKAILWAVEKGITNGKTADTFGIRDTVTRAQMLTFQWRAAGKPSVSGSTFSDVKGGAYYEGAVAWAVSKGITKGTSATTFSPDANCVRGQIVTFLYRELA